MARWIHRYQDVGVVAALFVDTYSDTPVLVQS